MTRDRNRPTPEPARPARPPARPAVPALPPTRSRALPLAVAVVAAAVAACGPAAAPRVDPATLSPDVRIVHGISVRFGDRGMLGRGVVVKSGPRLDVFVLAPTGTRLLTVRQEGLHVQSDVRAAELARLDPDRLLRDIRRAFFARCPVPPGPAPERLRCRVAGDDIVETRDPSTGAVVARTFGRGRDRVAVTMVPDPDAPADAFPRRLRMTDAYADYSIEIVVESMERLAPPPAAPDAP